ncbi:MAG: DUF5050 domain-containing protein [Clostridia bacterium]|nr:DUF5050 domain-containing protein [Clostridia bacterium]
MQEINLKTSEEEKNIGKILKNDKKIPNSGGSNDKPPSKHDFSFFKKIHEKLLKSKMILGIGVVGVVCLVLLSVFCISQIKRAFEPEIALGNLNNNGKVLQDGQSVYLGLSEGLFKETNGVLTKVSGDRATSIMRHGDSLYYLCSASQRSFDIKALKDGSEEPQMIKTIYTSINKIYVNQDSVYYVSSENGYGIRKISMKDMNESLVILANIVDFTIEDDILYYTDIAGKLERINLSKTEEAPFTIDSSHSIRKFQVRDKWIYFYSNRDGGLCKIKMNGKGFEVVNKNINNDSYNITEKGNIYFLDRTKTKICKGKIEGNSYKTIAETKITNSTLNIASQNLYYENYVSETSSITKLYRVKTNGKPANEIIVPEEKEEEEDIELDEVENKVSNENVVNTSESSNTTNTTNTNTVNTENTVETDNVEDVEKVETENTLNTDTENVVEENKEENDIDGNNKDNSKKDEEDNSENGGVITILTDEETSN